MSNAILKIFCLVDIIASTDHMHSGTGQTAHADMIEGSSAEFKSILEAHNGNYENFTGDGHLASFSDPNKALSFAIAYARSQEKAIYKNKIALTAGSATYTKAGVISDDIHFATRLLSNGKPGSIIISESAYELLYKLDHRIATQVSIVSNQLIRDYGTKNYYLYCIQEQQNITPNISGIKALFNSAEIYPVNILDGDYRENSILIWPVVPRTSLNLIHIWQLSVIKFLCTNLGWKLKILIADLMDSISSVKSDYTKKMDLYLKNTKIDVDEILYLSELLQQQTNTCCQITNGTFNSYLKLITFEQMEKFIGKDYNTLNYKKRSVWETLRPFFTLAASAYLSSTLDKKCIILAGYDEHDMWNACTIHPSYERNLSAILIPILKKNDNSQFSHEDKAFYWRSSEAIKNAIRDSNIAEWANDLLLKIHHDPEMISEDWDDTKKQLIADIILKKLNLQHESTY